MASLLLAQRLGDFAPGSAPSAPALAPGGRSELRAHDYQRSLSIVVWNGQGQVLSQTGEAPTPAFTQEEGFATLQLGRPATGWRAFSRWDAPGHERKITVLLSLAERDDLADDIAWQVAEPGLWLLPIVALLLVLAIRKGLRPLLDLSDQVHRLDVHRDTLLQAPPHEEFKEIVQAIHLLIERYNAALSRERNLASEVAHELRTPLASLGLHAASLRGALTPAEHSEALARVEEEAARASAVLTHVLALARASRAELAETMQPLDLAELARGVAAEYAQPAYLSGHELSVDGPERCPARGHPVLLEMALRNLIDNALAYTPRGTAVQVIVTAHPPALEVRDNGRAMGQQGATDSAARQNLGMGLGHEVVQRVAAVHGGRFERAEGSATEPARYRIIPGGGP
ncbi:MAG: histidine kinase dimerization/phospho-acceptor domain-containing protein [Burkholderiales bacterium]|nr:histidine kinase dimerization/phospho-acceptor domain-containing protein [Burkholderiales bacterium]